MKKIEIEIDKKKTLMALSLSLFCVTLGIIVILNPHNFISTSKISSEFRILTGIVFVSIYFTTSIYRLKILVSKNNLTIDSNGINDNISLMSNGLIKWNEITDIKSVEFMLMRFLLIFVKNPEEKLEEASGMKRKLMAKNMKKFGTPFSITSTVLKCNFNELEKLLKDKLTEYN
ncbi:hypothetical protein LZQ00_15605 [Sphingobacterium sp. SRCM116780]|uniref:STM3941 family protein n=1 Tax=Sphingobacterium sp. SRCM116780 TaxID=2907623 RepID=UPI001F445681|nr:STM3941 family protein [Sphingobacterium sp. SRCM116780]UIR55683.1 hypothetical protein LZQ00_15605 [Sphingobacterium sp. SRCM116780]